MLRLGAVQDATADPEDCIDLFLGSPERLPFGDSLCRGSRQIAHFQRRQFAWNTASGVPNSRNSRAAMPGVKISASHEKEASGSIAFRAHGHDNVLVKST
jgi:hypothetical protein